MGRARPTKSSGEKTPKKYRSCHVELGSVKGTGGGEKKSTQEVRGFWGADREVKVKTLSIAETGGPLRVLREE